MQDPHGLPDYGELDRYTRGFTYDFRLYYGFAFLFPARVIFEVVFLQVQSLLGNLSYSFDR